MRNKFDRQLQILEEQLIHMGDCVRVRSRMRQRR